MDGCIGRRSKKKDHVPVYVAMLRGCRDVTLGGVKKGPRASATCACLLGYMRTYLACSIGNCKSHNRGDCPD